ncbi:MAG TPA: PKD domain-containing protein [Thermoplasmatales archaeon]|nr:PKD domain-containing protein [Thermoplasmatales archaeon]
MKKLIAFTSLSLLITIILFPSLAEGRVDAKFIIRDMNGRQIFMKSPDGKIIYGNVLVGEKIIFDARKSNSMYPIDKYYWDFDGDGKYDEITSTPIVHYTYEKAGEYNATLLAVATSAPPHGDGDTITHKIIVVDNLLPPVAIFEIERRENGTFIFNASKSYDKDGYIMIYKWDFDGDGKYDETGSTPLALHNYSKNGYYVVSLTVVDYDLLKSKKIRIIKISNLNGSINEIKGEIKIENKCEESIDAFIIINNNEKFNVSIEANGNYVINPLLSPSLNEIYIYSEGKNATFIFNGSEGINIIVKKNSIYTSDEEINRTAGFNFLALFIAILIIWRIKTMEKD